MYLSSFFPTKRYARLHLPLGGSLGSHFPTFPACPALGHRYYVPLRLPLHHPGSLRLSLASRYLVSHPCVSCPLRLVSGMRAAHLRLACLYTGRLVSGCSFTRSWRFSQVPRLPLYAHAPLDDSGGVPGVCHITPGTVAFQPNETVGFPRHHNGLSLLSLGTTNIQFSELSYAACTLTTPGFIHTLLDMHAGSLPVRWLLSPGGNWWSPTSTHWVTLTNFTSSFSIP